MSEVIKFKTRIKAKQEGKADRVGFNIFILRT